MPNWTFLTLHFFHMMALVIWVGGMVAIGAIVAPVAFREAPDRSVAGRIVGLSLQRFDVVVVACIVSLVVSSGLMARWYGRWSPWYGVQYACIALMSLSALSSMTFVAPKMRSMRRDLADGAMSANAAEFDRLHRLAMLSMQFNLACGTIAILFS